MFLLLRETDKTFAPQFPPGCGAFFVCVTLSLPPIKTGDSGPSYDRRGDERALECVIGGAKRIVSAYDLYISCVVHLVPLARSRG